MGTWVGTICLKFTDPHVEHQDYLNGYFMKHLDNIRKTKIILHISSDSGPASVTSVPWLLLG